MLLRPENLPRDPDVLIGMVIERDVEIERLKTALKTLNGLIHGPRSERASVVFKARPSWISAIWRRTSLWGGERRRFDAADCSRAKPRKKARRNIGFLPKHLPRVEEVIEPESTDCPCCAGKLHRIGEETGEALDGVPATLRFLRTIRPKYACRSCQGAVVQAPARVRLFDGGMATTALIANVVVWKFAWYLPLHRQVQILAGQGVNLDRATLALWVKRVAWWLTPLYDLQLRKIHGYPRIFCDETRAPVLEKGRKRVRIHQFWAHAVDDRPWNGPASPAVAYIFAKSRGHREIKSQLANYQGVVQVDAYSAYTALAKAGRSPGPIKLAFCMAHARRQFTDVYKKTQSAVARDARVVRENLRDRG